jgi:hypothetical protein
MIGPTDKLVLRCGSGVRIPNRKSLRWKPIRGAADPKPASTSSAKRFFVAEETDAGEFHTWLWRGASLVSVV